MTNSRKYRKIQTMANKKPKYRKITSQLKEKMRIAYVQGDVDIQGFRRLSTIEELAEENKLSKNTLYKVAQRENWKLQQEQFQKDYEQQLDKERLKEFAKESVKFDLASVNIAKALLTKVGNLIRNSQNSSLDEFSPQQLDSIANVALKTQKFVKLAFGESTENINVNTSEKQTAAFREAMELLDSIEDSRSRSNKSTH